MRDSREKGKENNGVCTNGIKRIKRVHLILN